MSEGKSSMPSSTSTRPSEFSVAHKLFVWASSYSWRREGHLFLRQFISIVRKCSQPEHQQYCDYRGGHHCRCRWCKIVLRLYSPENNVSVSDREIAESSAIRCRLRDGRCWLLFDRQSLAVAMSSGSLFVFDWETKCLELLLQLFDVTP